MRPSQLPANMRSKITLEPCPLPGLSGKCWVWTGGCASGRYGCVSYQGRTRSTHKLAYTLLVGPVPDGLQCDHLCRNIRCCNPLHIEPVTGEVNKERARVHRDRCPQGHPLAAPNLIVKKQGRIRNCRVCALDYARRYRAAHDSQIRNYASADRHRAEILAEAEANLIVDAKKKAA